MSDLLAKPLTVTEETSERAKRAVSAFRLLQPTLTAYARVLSGKKSARVDMAARDNGSTDGTRIYYRPPMALGDNTPHNKPVCRKRGLDGLQFCPACAIREDVLVTVYHEIAHICFESFAVVSDADKKRAIECAVKEAGGKWAEKIQARIENAPSYVTNSYMGLTGLINEYLPFLFNCLEDARVNRELFKARTGVKKMFTADTAKVFREGFESRNPKGYVEQNHWHDAPLNSQAMIGVFVKTSGYDYSGWFAPEVIEALDDEELANILRGMDTVRSASGIYNLAFKVLARLRDLGYCATKEDPDPAPPEPEPEEEEEPDESDEESTQTDPTDDPPEQPEHGPDEREGDVSDSDPVPEESDSPDAEREDEAGADEGGDQDSEGSGDLRNQHDSEPDEPVEGEPEGDSDGSDGSPEGESSISDADEDFEGDSGRSDGEDESDSSSGSGGDDPNFEQGTDEGEGPEESDATGSGSSEAVGTDGEPDDGSTEDESVIDAGADDGYGGTEIIGDQPEPQRPDMGTPDDVKVFMDKWSDHEEKPKSIAIKAAEDAVDKAIIQGIYFTNPSTNIFGVREHFWDKHSIDEVSGLDFSMAWEPAALERSRKRFGQDADLEVSEQVIQPALVRMRRAFTDNKRANTETNKRSGRVNRRVLGKRAALGDDRLFSKTTQPGKKDYFVVIGMDISGSTMGKNLALEKRAIAAQAEMLSRVGIGFSIYAHTGNYHGFDTTDGLDLEIYHIKDPGEKWNSETKMRLEAIGPSSANLDGHAMEWLRKRADEASASDRIILYYSDVKMPAENHNEELEILTREIRTCRSKGYVLLGVGIRTDSPARHGLETVQVDEDSDLVKVVEQLGRRLIK